MLGPAESLVPICFKAGVVGHGYAGAVAAFVLGTFVSSAVLLAYGRVTWNEPLKLVRNLSWTHRGVAVLPALMIVSTGLIFIVRLR